jgi:hypothetical protein
MFKVKTTLPSTYYVSPNQDSLMPDEEIKVLVVLVNEECNAYIESNNTRGAPESVERHRFKVEAVKITFNQYNELKEIPSETRSTEYNRILDGVTSDEKSVAKFSVNYKYPSRTNTLPQTGTGTLGQGHGNDGNGNGNESKNNLHMATAKDLNAHANMSLSSEQQQRAKYSSNSMAGIGSYDDNKTIGVGVAAANDPSSIDSVLSELQALRTRYDKVLELTVNLTAEKDTMMARLEAKQNERKETMKLLNERDRKGAKSIASAKAKNGMFSQTFIILAGIFAFLLGYYLEQQQYYSNALPKSASVSTSASNFASASNLEL